MPALQVELSGTPHGLLAGGQPAALAELVGDGLAGPAEVTDYLGVHPVRLGPAALAQHVAGPLERPPGAVRQWQAQVHADVDDHPGGAHRRPAQHAESRARLAEPAELVGQPFGVQGPAFAVPAHEHGLGVAGQPVPRHHGRARLQVMAGHALVEDGG